MKNCLYCGQPNPEENQFCNKCGADIVNSPAVSVNDSDQTNGASTQDANTVLRQIREQNTMKYLWWNSVVKFVLYLHCVLLPTLGLVLGVIVSVTPFPGQKELSSKLIRCACIAQLVWIPIFFFIGFFSGFFSSL